MNFMEADISFLGKPPRTEVKDKNFYLTMANALVDSATEIDK